MGFTDWSQGDSFSKSDNVEGWSQVDSFSQSDNVVDMDCSESDSSGRKRKSSELPRYNKVRVIATNPELNAENDIESSILFRPWEDRNMFGPGRGRAEKNPKQVEPEKEKNPKKDEPEKEKNPKKVEPEKEKNSNQVEAERDSDQVEPQAETYKEQGEETVSFKNRLYTITFKPSNAVDLNKLKEKYKNKI